MVREIEGTYERDRERWERESRRSERRERPERERRERMYGWGEFEALNRRNNERVRRNNNSASTTTTTSTAIVNKYEKWKTLIENLKTLKSYSAFRNIKFKPAVMNKWLFQEFVEIEKEIIYKDIHKHLKENPEKQHYILKITQNKEENYLYDILDELDKANFKLNFIGKVWSEGYIEKTQGNKEKTFISP